MFCGCSRLPFIVRSEPAICPRRRFRRIGSFTAKWRWRLRGWLAHKPALRELCAAREALFSLHRVRGHGCASRALARLTDALALALSSPPELKTLRNTLMRRRREVLAYFLCRLTNGRTEGFNGKAKLVIRRAYG
jgi:transposase